jgi:hypothetical protein
VNVDRSSLSKIGEDMRRVPEDSPTNHVSGSMAVWSNIESESWRCCWIRIWLEIGWLDAAQSASSMPQLLIVYCAGVDRRSG